MPTDNISASERFYNQLCTELFANWLDRQPKPQPKLETCPYCGSADLDYHRIPLEREGLMVFCLNCGETWDK